MLSSTSSLHLNPPPSPRLINPNPLLMHPLNLKVLQRHDPSIVDIIESATYVVLYHYEDDGWKKEGIEGSMFIYKRLVLCSCTVQSTCCQGDDEMRAKRPERTMKRASDCLLDPDMGTDTKERDCDCFLLIHVWALYSLVLPTQSHKSTRRFPQRGSHTLTSKTLPWNSITHLAPLPPSLAHHPFPSISFSA